LHSFEVKDNCIFGYLLTNEPKIFKKWSLEFKNIPRRSTVLKKGYEVDDDLTTKKLWATVSNKFDKIDQLIEQHNLDCLEQETESIIESEEYSINDDLITEQISENEFDEIEIEIIENDIDEMDIEIEKVHPQTPSPTLSQTVSQTQTPLRISSRSNKGIKKYSSDYVYTNLPSLKPIQSQSQSQPLPQTLPPSSFKSQRKSKELEEPSKKRINPFFESNQNKSRKIELNKKRKNQFQETIDDSESETIEYLHQNPKKARKMSTQSSQSQSQSQTPTLSPDEELYSLYVDFDKLQISDIKTYDKQFHLSGLLSYVINHNYFKKNEIIELVDTNQLWDYKEYDRTTSSKYSSDCGVLDINEKFASILKIGFLEPLHINCNTQTNNCYVDEGNHRLAFAYHNKIPFVPARVIASSTCDGKQIPFNTRGLPKDKLTASMLGFKTVSNFPNHPYLPFQLSSKLIKEKFLNPYDIGLDKLLLKNLQSFIN
jgi:hypothetical protein